MYEHIFRTHKAAHLKLNSLAKLYASYYNRQQPCNYPRNFWPFSRAEIKQSVQLKGTTIIDGPHMRDLRSSGSQLLNVPFVQLHELDRDLDRNLGITAGNPRRRKQSVLPLN